MTLLCYFVTWTFSIVLCFSNTTFFRLVLFLSSCVVGGKRHTWLALITRLKMAHYMTQDTEFTVEFFTLKKVIHSVWYMYG